MDQLAKNLRFIRRAKRVTQAQLASSMKKGQTTIGNWENDYSDPSVKDLVDLSNFYGVDIHTLITIDLEDGNLIDENGDFLDPEKRMQNGNLIGNLIGNLNEANRGKTGVQVDPRGANQEGENNTLWLLLQEVRRISEKADLMRVSLDSIENKLPRK